MGRRCSRRRTERLAKAHLVGQQHAPADLHGGRHANALVRHQLAQQRGPDPSAQQHSRLRRTQVLPLHR